MRQPGETYPIHPNPARAAVILIKIISTDIPYTAVLIYRYTLAVQLYSPVRARAAVRVARAGSARTATYDSFTEQERRALADEDCRLWRSGA